jgi:Flp pilus assembly protein TadG
MMWRRLLQMRLRAFCDDENATATLEFVIVFPILMLLFIAAFETAMILTRQVMLERTLDQAVRVLRLAQGVVTDADTVRQTMCSNTQLLPDCSDLLAIDLQLVNRTTYEMPAEDEICANRGSDTVIQPNNEFQVGSDNQFLLIRTCLLVDRILPISGFGLNLARDDSGGMHMIAQTIFVNEPD